jgi:hypothetical protein
LALKADVYCFLIMLEYILFLALSLSKFLGPLYRLRKQSSGCSSKEYAHEKFIA